MQLGEAQHCPLMEDACCRPADTMIAWSCCRLSLPGVPIFLCAWHVKQAWVQGLRQKVMNDRTRSELLEDLDSKYREAAADQKRAHQLTLLPSNASAVARAEASSALPLSMRPQLAAGQGMQ